jgi:hypothetical protein
MFPFFCFNSDGCKLYMKIVAFDEIYNFVVQNFSILSHFHSQIIDILSRSQFSYKISVAVYVQKFVTVL